MKMRRVERNLPYHQTDTVRAPLIISNCQRTVNNLFNSMLNSRSKYVTVITIWLVVAMQVQQVLAFLVPLSTQTFNLKQSPHRSPSRLQTKKDPVQDLTKELGLADTQVGGHTYIRFSRAFQRHVVYKCTDNRKQNLASIYHDYQCDHTLDSFMFLDEAMAKYPHATLEKLLDVGQIDDENAYELILAGMGNIPSSAILTIQNGEMSAGSGIEAMKYLASMAMSGQRINLPPPGSDQFNQMRDSFVHQLGMKIAPKRFESHTKESIRQNYDHVVDVLTRGLTRKLYSTGDDGMLMQLEKAGLAFTEADARAVISDFPQLCLYDIHELEERIKFITSPMEAQSDSMNPGQKDMAQKSKKDEVDFYMMMRSGYGAGLSVEQATEVVRAVPQFLSVYHEDSQKPHLLHFYRKLDIPTRFLDQARIELGSRTTGCDGSDIFAFAYLNSIGISWDKIRLVIDAFPVITFGDSEPAWELIDNKSRIGNDLKTDALICLRKRLQISNSDLFAMMKTHSRLTSYGSSSFLPKLNAIQSRLNLSTRELQRVVLRMPSVTGMSVDSTSQKMSALDARIDFFLNEARLSPDDLKEAIAKQPSLLQYSINSTLRPKLDFLIKELAIEENSVSRIIRAAPAILGLSLEQNLRPKVALLQDECNLSKQEIANMIITVPAILLLSLKRKIEPCLDFLRNELRLFSPNELGHLIQTSPRILTHGVDTSLSPKIQMITNGLIEEGAASAESAFEQTLNIIKINPSLLVTTNALLQSRINKYLKDDNAGLAAFLKPRTVGRKKIAKTVDDDQNALTMKDKKKKRKQKHRVIEVNNDQTIVNTYPSVKEAAALLGVSVSTIHASCGKGKEVKGKYLRYLYSNDSVDDRRPRYSFQDLKTLPFTLYEMEGSTVSIAAFASGCIYPSDDINSVRGMRKAGGIAIHVPQATPFEDIFQDAVKTSFGLIMPHTVEGASNEPGIVQAGFPFLRPSRSRCDLYACHGALKVILQLLKQAAEVRDMRDTNVNIDIYTDSTYALGLLKDTDNLLEWGSAPTLEDTLFEGVSGPLSLANTDLLFPLTKTMHRMTNNAVINKDRNKRLCIGKRVNINFRYVRDLPFDKDNSQRIRDLHASARSAAMWQFKMG